MNQTVSTNKRPVHPLDRFAYLIATGAGAGFAPVAPGTFGAAEGVAIFFGVHALTINALNLTPQSSLLLFVILNIAVFAIGVWASNRACEICELEDPSQVVVDEISGQMIALVPLAPAPSVVGVIAAFALFRVFDIFKPYPIRRLERLRAGLGVMSDDALAGIYAAALVWLGIYFRLI
ncbi:MAG TPA: phosphatidylglycerophosphatase A [Blastocatellia bacterium]|nr:phosphatidylglycerophosphatase A [Blastocatellia bacterium]